MSLTTIRALLTVAAAMVWVGWILNGFDAWGTVLVVLSTTLAALWWLRPDLFRKTR